jgi:uncharacterized membrane protein
VEQSSADQVVDLAPEDEQSAPFSVESGRHLKAYITMLVSSLVSLGASLVLAIDAISLAKNVNAKLSCNINAIISCGKVGVSWQSNLLGFPNAFLGLICEPVVITIAIAGLGRVVFPKRFMKSALAVYFAGLLFAFWLFSQSYFVIKAFCPWCMLVTISTVSVFFSMLRVNLLDNTFNFSKERYERICAKLYSGKDTVIVAAIYTIIVTAVILKYGQYFLA